MQEQRFTAVVAAAVAEVRNAPHDLFTVALMAGRSRAEGQPEEALWGGRGTEAVQQPASASQPYEQVLCHSGATTLGVLVRTDQKH